MLVSKLAFSIFRNGNSSLTNLSNLAPAISLDLFSFEAATLYSLSHTLILSSNEDKVSAPNENSATLFSSSALKLYSLSGGILCFLDRPRISNSRSSSISSSCASKSNVTTSPSIILIASPNSVVARDNEAKASSNGPSLFLDAVSIHLIASKIKLSAPFTPTAFWAFKISSFIFSADCIMRLLASNSCSSPSFGLTLISSSNEYRKNDSSASKAENFFCSSCNSFSAFLSFFQASLTNSRWELLAANISSRCICDR